MIPLLSVIDLTKEYPLRRWGRGQAALTAVDHVSFDLDVGQTLGIVGESGSGKSTLGRCVLHLTPITSGRVILEGRDIHSLSERQMLPLRRKMQMVFQNPLTSFSPMMTIGQALLDAMRLLPHHDDRHRRVFSLLEQVQLDSRIANLYPYEISGGQLQRAGIARALAPEPALLFLDEPTSALDISIQGQIVNLLLDLQKERQLAYIFVSHDLRVVQYVADDILVMQHGKVVERGTKTAIFTAPRHPYTQTLVSAAHLHRSVGSTGSIAGNLFDQRSSKE
jgi:ABC-type oligopeptide transport system ATPase subunit